MRKRVASRARSRSKSTNKVEEPPPIELEGEIGLILQSIETDFKKKGKERKLDDVLHHLFDLEKYLQVTPFETIMPVFGVIETFLVDRVVKKVSSLVLRDVIASCIMKLYQHSTRNLDHAYQTLTSCFTAKIDSGCKLSALTSYGTLLGEFGYKFIGSMNETVSNLTKFTKSSEDYLKVGALWALEQLYIGTGGPGTRGDMDTEILKHIIRCMNDKSVIVRRATVSVIITIIKVSVDCKELDPLYNTCLKLLGDSDLQVRHKHANCLGTILYLASQKDYKVKSSQGNSSSLTSAFTRKRVEVHSLPDALRALISPLTRSSPTVRASLYEALLTLLKSSKAQMLPELAENVTYVINLIIGPLIATSQEGNQIAHGLLRAITRGLLSGTEEHALELTAEKIYTMLQDSTMQTNVLNIYQLQVCLGIQSYIYTQLGCAIEHLKVRDLALQPLLAHLTHPSKIIRIHTAQCFRQLGRATPSQISDWLTVLYKFAGVQLAELVQSGDDVEASLFFSLHGHLCALAATTEIIQESETGVPTELLENMFDLCQRIFGLNCGTFGSAVYNYKHAIKNTTWAVLDALISQGMEWIGSRLNALFSIFKQTLGAKSILGSPAAVASQLEERTQALITLRTFVTIFQKRMYVSSNGDPSSVLKPTVRYVRNTFLALKTITEQKSIDPVVQVAMEGTKSLLFDIFAALPAASYTSIFVNLLHMSVANITVNNPAGSREIFEKMNPTDACLGRTKIFFNIYIYIYILSCSL